jgi:large subunit ribosomal protein L4
MQLDLFDTNGKASGQKVELNTQVFNSKVSKAAIYESVKNHLANKRVGTASTKTRSEVRGGGAKPYRQKGTGRARHGTRRSPIWRNGGITFGPKPRDYSYKLPKKFKRLAIRSILTHKRKQQKLKIVEDFSIESGKTKDMVKILINIIEKPEKVVLIYKEEDIKIKQSIRNIPWAIGLNYKRLNAKDMFYAKTIIIQHSALKELNEMYALKEKKEDQTVNQT